MARPGKGSSRVDQPLKLDTIRGFHVDCEESLKLYYSPAQANTNQRFSSYSKAELSEELAQNIVELELRSSFVILTMLEAYFLIDHQQRVKKKGKDALSQCFLKIAQSKPRKVSLGSDIFDAWKNHTNVPEELISDLKRIFMYRHWFAHGRYWRLEVAPREYDYATVYQLAQLTMQSFPFIAPNRPTQQ